MRERILVLEDDAELREALVETLEDEDYGAVGVATGADALRRTRANPFHLVVADVRIQGLDGIEVLRRIRKMCPSTKAIVMTGYASEDAPARALQVEVEDYLYKPFSLQDFLVAVERVLTAAEEQERYLGLLAPFMSGYRKLVQTAGVAIARAELASLDRVRDSVFHGLYVGIRSHKLALSDALQVWDRLEALEREREKLKFAGLHLKERQELAEGYRFLVDSIAATSSRYRGTSSPRRQPDQVPLGQFRDFYTRIRDGEVSLQLVVMAPFLRALEPFTLEQSPDLQALHAALWGPAP